MGIFTTTLFTTLMLGLSLAHARLFLSSLCSAEHWREEMERVAEGLKDHSALRWPQRLCHGGKVHWNFPGKLNQGGFAEAPALVLLVLLAFLVGGQAYVWGQRLSQTKSHLAGVLCLKEALIAQKQLTGRIQKINGILAAGRISQTALLLTGVGAGAALNWERVQQLLKRTQDLSWLKTQATLARLRSQGCPVPPEAFISAYRWSDSTLARLPSGLALLARKEGRQVWLTPLARYRVNWSLSSPVSRAIWQVL